MDANALRSSYLHFFQRHGHAIIPSASLVPENDPTTLFTGSGMQPLIPYLLGAEHSQGRRIADAQKSFRAEDIEEVGDNRHTTFFEMLGNWSLGDYFKQEQLSWLFSFLTDTENGAGLDPERLYVTVFAGDAENNVPRDTESVSIWKKLFAEKGVDAKDVELLTESRGGERGMQGGRIFYYDAKKNWWSRSGTPDQMPVGEPGGPDSEIFYEFLQVKHDPKFGNYCHPNCDCGRFMEIGNSVFMEYRKNADGSFDKLAQRNVDFGGGLERIAAAMRDDPDIFHVDVFDTAREDLTALTGKPYAGNEQAFRVVLDHIRAAVFLIADGVLPSNVGRGYLVRRLIRRAVRFSDSLSAPSEKTSSRDMLGSVAQKFIDQYAVAYPQGYGLEGDVHHIVAVIQQEEKKFRATLRKGLEELEKMIGSFSPHIDAHNSSSDLREVDPVQAFLIYQSYGFPLEMIQEELGRQNLFVDEKKFQTEMRKHQELSRTASVGAFKGGLADHSVNTTRLHTAHHLLLHALQVVLGPDVKQRGSNITGERLRLDFSYGTKMTDEQKAAVERLVNEQIAEDLPVIRSEMPREEAEQLNAEHEFGQKYPDRVSVYSIGPKGAIPEHPDFAHAFSLEFCAGPHVQHTGELGHFSISKEEAVSAGIRRIKAVLS